MTEALNSSDPGAITSAVGWLEGTLLGAFAMTVAIVAVAMVGFLMLSGRIDVRRTTQVVLGCFIIFGASTIANGIFKAISGETGADLAQAAPPPPPPSLPQPTAYPKAAASPFDPYAGAALPPRR